MDPRPSLLLAALAIISCASPTDTAPRWAPATEEPDFTPRRAPVIGGEVVERAVIWPATPPDSGAMNALGETDRNAAARAPAPVLLLPPEHDLSGGQFMAGPTWWATRQERDGMVLVVQASAAAHLHPAVGSITPNDRVRHLPGWVTQNEGIWSLSWIEFGAAYTLELDCADPARPRCRDDAHVRELATALVYAGGKGATR